MSFTLHFTTYHLPQISIKQLDPPHSHFLLTLHCDMHTFSDSLERVPSTCLSVCPDFLGVTSLEKSCSLNYPVATFGSAWFQLLLSCVSDKPICGFWELGPLPGSIFGVKAAFLNHAQAVSWRYFEFSDVLKDQTWGKMSTVNIAVDHFPIDFLPNSYGLQ